MPTSDGRTDGHVTCPLFRTAAAVQHEFLALFFLLLLLFQSPPLLLLPFLLPSFLLPSPPLTNDQNCERANEYFGDVTRMHEREQRS